MHKLQFKHTFQVGKNEVFCSLASRHNNGTATKWAISHLATYFHVDFGSGSLMKNVDISNATLYSWRFRQFLQNVRIYGTKGAYKIRITTLLKQHNPSHDERRYFYCYFILLEVSTQFFRNVGIYGTNDAFKIMKIKHF